MLLPVVTVSWWQLGGFLRKTGLTCFEDPELPSASSSSSSASSVSVFVHTSALIVCKMPYTVHAGHLSHLYSSLWLYCWHFANTPLTGLWTLLSPLRFCFYFTSLIIYYHRHFCLVIFAEFPQSPLSFLKNEALHCECTTHTSTSIQLISNKLEYKRGNFLFVFFTGNNTHIECGAGIII